MLKKINEKFIPITMSEDTVFFFSFLVATQTCADVSMLLFPRTTLVFAFILKLFKQYEEYIERILFLLCLAMIKIRMNRAQFCF